MANLGKVQNLCLISEMLNRDGDFSPIEEVPTPRTHSGTQGGADEEWRKSGIPRQR